MTLSDFADGRYHLRVHGPNGFFRELRGGSDDPLLSVRADTEVDATGMATGQVRVVLRAAVGSPTLTIRLASHGYDQAPLTRTLSAGAETTLSIPLTTSHGWYDFSVMVADAAGFHRRYAGRVETGLPSRTDPVMGRETAG